MLTGRHRSRSSSTGSVVHQVAVARRGRVPPPHRSALNRGELRGIDRRDSNACSSMPTLADVAKIAGVGLMSVSRVVNGTQKSNLQPHLPGGGRGHDPSSPSSVNDHVERGSPRLVAHRCSGARAQGGQFAEPVRRRRSSIA